MVFSFQRPRYNKEGNKLTIVRVIGDDSEDQTLTHFQKM